MKLSKTLLSAMLVGIAVQTLPSCKKENGGPTFKETIDKLKEKITKPQPPYFCPGCGMG